MNSSRLNCFFSRKIWTRDICFLFLISLAIANGSFAHAEELLSHNDELECLSLMYMYNVFGDEKPKGSPIGGFSAPTPGEAISPFQPGDYLPKLNRIEKAATAGNIYANYVLSMMYASGTCVPRNGDLVDQYIDKGRAYIEWSQRDLELGQRYGHVKEAALEALTWLKEAINRYPYVSEKDARIALSDRGNKNPSEVEIQAFIKRVQPPKEQIVSQAKKILEAVVGAGQVSQVEADEMDVKSTKLAADWVKNHP